jgi:glycosyltransferase involved in cell wall biosynthesis
MKIAFDGTVLHGRKSGVGYYCEELLKAMLQISHTDQFFVFSHQPLTLNLASANGNLKLSNTTFFPVRALYLHALLPRILGGTKPDLCHYTNFLAPLSNDHPYVVTIHDMGLEVLRGAHPLAKRLYTRRLIPRVARHAKLILANSEYSKWEIIRHLGIPEDRIRVTPLAASDDFKPVPVNRDRPYFLYVGNLEPRKNLQRLIEAFAHIPEKEHNLVIVGHRRYRGGEVEAKARSLGLNGRVKFLGYVPRADLPGLYSGATALVYPSLLEGFGLPVVEAMACGTPVITSNNSALKEVAGDAARLINPLSIQEMTEAMTQLTEDSATRHDLSQRGIRRAAEFSWRKTALLTLAAYADVLRPSGGRTSCKASPEQSSETIANAIRRTVAYSNLFQYPLSADELRERLFDVRVDEDRFRQVLATLNIGPTDEMVRLRSAREAISDRAIGEVRPFLSTLISLPFVRMLAFSGSTAHRNMTSTEDIDLFMVVEDGKVWAVFLMAMIWAKVRGLRRRLCLNYVISDAALPLFEGDPFTAQQVASLKPFYGKTVYDRFIRMNPFVRRRFPNFEPALHREAYSEMRTRANKTAQETVLRFGPIQVLERLSRAVLGRYLRRKINETSDVQLNPRCMKLHLRSHKIDILSGKHQFEEFQTIHD